MKACTKCLQQLPQTSFHANKNSKDGKCHYCKDCRRAIKGQKPYLKTVEEYFWRGFSCGEPNDCWLWTEYRTTANYGRFTTKGETYHAHILSYEIFNGPNPEGLFVCHSCDNPPCVNPRHLFLGTHVINMNDCTKKGRRKHRFTDEEVREIRSLYPTLTLNQLGTRYKVSDVTIFHIIKRNSYTHIV